MFPLRVNLAPKLKALIDFMRTDEESDTRVLLRGTTEDASVPGEFIDRGY